MAEPRPTEEPLELDAARGPVVHELPPAPRTPEEIRELERELAKHDQGGRHA